ncbi:hypothetical protein ACTXT7_008457 [Hymenolepis weldensis]
MDSENHFQNAPDLPPDSKIFTPSSVIPVEYASDIQEIKIGALPLLDSEINEEQINASKPNPGNQTHSSEIHPTNSLGNPCKPIPLQHVWPLIFNKYADGDDHH